MGLFTAVGGAVGHGVVAAGMGAACVAAGAAILKDAGHHDYYASAGAASGAVGGAVLGGGLGLLGGLFAPEKSTNTSKASLTSQIVGHAVGTVLSGMAGIGILHAAGHYRDFSLGDSAAAAAVGAAVIYGGMGVILGTVKCLCGGGSARNPARAATQPASAVELV